jgi:hypothetical protein
MADAGRETPPELQERGELVYDDVQFEIYQSGEAEKPSETTRISVRELLPLGNFNREAFQVNKWKIGDFPERRQVCRVTVCVTERELTDISMW